MSAPFPSEVLLSVAMDVLGHASWVKVYATGITPELMEMDLERVADVVIIAHAKTIVVV